jgi:hypothetical protein
MQAQQELRINAAPLTAALVIFASLVIGGFGGYAVSTALRSSTAIALTPQVATPRVPAVAPAQLSNLTTYEGRICTADLRFCLEAQSSAASPATQPAPALMPTFDEGRMCTADFRFCREPQNSYD